MINKLKAALDAFEAVLRWIDDYAETTGFDTVEAMADAALPDLRSVIAEMEAGKPVAFVEVVDTYEGPYKFDGLELLGKGRHLLYTHTQPKAEPVNARLAAFEDIAAVATVGATYPELMEYLKSEIDAAQIAQPKAEPGAKA